MALRRHLTCHAQAKTAGSAPAASWPPKRIVFINDVFFCARDAVRLLLHKADMACGLDYVLYPVCSPWTPLQPCAMQYLGRLMLYTSGIASLILYIKGSETD